MLIKSSKGWKIPERLATPEPVYINRRRFLQSLGLVGAGVLSGATGCLQGSSSAESNSADLRDTLPKPSPPYPVARNPGFVVNRSITSETVAASYNNFYEFTTDKEEVWRKARKFETRPWQVEVTGLVHHPRTYDIDDLVKRMPLEERVYRFRCVEAWSMVLPWTGFHLKALIDEVQPSAQAKYVRFITFNRPQQAPGQRWQPWYPWPYFEGLTMAEASNELTLLATGIYGHALPAQHGAPIRLVTPWKYGYKSIKSIVRIEFVDQQPATFWNKLAPSEYDFWANVNPRVPHPRWSQASERVVETGERIPTQLYNGYGEFVASLYGG